MHAAHCKLKPNELTGWTHTYTTNPFVDVTLILLPLPNSVISFKECSVFYLSLHGLLQFMYMLCDGLQGSLLSSNGMQRSFGWAGQWVIQTCWNSWETRQETWAAVWMEVSEVVLLLAYMPGCPVPLGPVGPVWPPPLRLDAPSAVVCLQTEPLSPQVSPYCHCSCCTSLHTHTHTKYKFSCVAWRSASFPLHSSSLTRITFSHVLWITVQFILAFYTRHKHMNNVGHSRDRNPAAQIVRARHNHIDQTPLCWCVRPIFCEHSHQTLKTSGLHLQTEVCC